TTSARLVPQFFPAAKRPRSALPTWRSAMPRFVFADGRPNVAAPPLNRRGEMTSFPRAFAALRGPGSSFHKLRGLRRRRPAARRPRPIPSPPPARARVAGSGGDGSSERGPPGGDSADGDGGPDPPPSRRRPRRVHEDERDGGRL